MHSSQLFVPPTLVERRRVVLSPDFLRAWQLVGWAGGALLAAATIELVFAGLARGEAAGAGALLDAAADRLHTLLLGLALGLGSAVARGRRNATRTLASTAIALGCFVLPAFAFAGLAWSSGRTEVAPLTAERVRSLLLAAAYATAFVALGACAWRHALRHEHVQLGR